MDEFNMLEHFPNTRIYNLAEFYGDFVPFTVNSIYPIHRWYRFKEGYSKDLVNLLLGSLGIDVKCCLDPFAGSGTTPLVCQEVGIPCYSIEVNPFLYHIIKAKLNIQYTIKDFDDSILALRKLIKKYLYHTYEEPIMSTITERPNLKKWLFFREVLQAILALRRCFHEIEPLYSNLFLVILASILIEVGNTTKDGKCVRYKKNWQDIRLNRDDVTNLFFKRAKLFREDINIIENRNWMTVNNLEKCLHGSSLEEIKALETNSVDLVMTSPPYLNSFDYTDVYMPELWALGFVNSYEDVQDLRASTFCSHVQVKWSINENALNYKIKLMINEVLKKESTLWNATIPDMIGGYFLDMEALLKELKRILRPHGKLCIIVGTSSNYQVTIPTDLLLAELATDLGFNFEEIRIIRNFRRSAKQSSENGKILPPLRESLMIFSM